MLRLSVCWCLSRIPFSTDLLLVLTWVSGLPIHFRQPVPNVRFRWYGMCGCVGCCFGHLFSALLEGLARPALPRNHPQRAAEDRYRGHYSRTEGHRTGHQDPHHFDLPTSWLHALLQSCRLVSLKHIWITYYLLCLYMESIDETGIPCLFPFFSLVLRHPLLECSDEHSSVAGKSWRSQRRTLRSKRSSGVSAWASPGTNMQWSFGSVNAASWQRKTFAFDVRVYVVPLTKDVKRTTLCNADVTLWI